MATNYITAPCLPTSKDRGQLAQLLHDDIVQIPFLPGEDSVAGHLPGKACNGHVSVQLTHDMEAGEECLTKYEKGNLDKMAKHNNELSSWAPVLPLSHPALSLLALSLSLALSILRTCIILSHVCVREQGAPTNCD